MEDSLPNTSALPPAPRPRPEDKMTILRVATAFFVSIFLGGAAVLVIHRVSFNRIVVFNQPTGPSVRITSVRLEKPGFVVISVEEEGGWKMVGVSLFLAAGYYKDLIIDIGIPYTMPIEDKDVTNGNFIPRNYTARLYIDRGIPYVFDDDFIDEPVRSSRGGIYQKRFWTRSNDAKIRGFLSWFFDNPIGNTTDLLFPY